MSKDKKSNKTRNRRNSTLKKVTNLMLVTAIAVPGIVGNLNVQTVEAATIYKWNKYAISTGTTVPMEKQFDVSNASEANYFATQVNGSMRYEGMYIIVTWQETTGGGEKIYVGQVTSTVSNAYPFGGYGEGGYYYEYVGSEETNSPPSTPTLDIPNVQFEHNDKHIISWSATDPNGDPLTYTLYAAYNGTNNWIQVYSGFAKNFEYTVPMDKSSVKFRLMVSDGKATSDTESSIKSIQPVMYYWNKFKLVEETYETWESKQVFYPNSEMTSEQYSAKVYEMLANPNYRNIESHSVSTGYSIFYEEKQINKGDPVKTFIQSLQAGYNAFPNNATHTDGYWYERGQRVLAGDTTPPIIELEVQKDYSLTPTISVRTYDSGTVQTVKWAKGNQSTLYFVNGGTEIATGQSIPSSFTVSENGIYTVFAIDNKGNSTVRTIEVTKVNQKPVVSKVFEALAIKGIGKEQVIDLKDHFNDPDGHQLKFEVVSSSEANVQAVIENGSQLKITGVGKGESKLTITATDGYEATTVQVDVTVSNTKPTLMINELPNHVVLDDQRHLSIEGTAADEDHDALTAKVKHLNHVVTAPVIEGKFSVDYQGKQVPKGYHHEDMQVTASDGLEDSEAYTASLPIIKVDDAESYTNEMAGHSDGYNTWTPEQHESFYNAYESIFKYETTRSEEVLSEAKEAISELQSKTVEASETITSWENRLDLVTATVATENAENGLVKADFELAKNLVETLVPSTEKEALVDRINELQRYHDADNAISVMEAENGRISWDAIKDAQDKVKAVENADNKKGLEDRLTQVIKDYMSNLETVTPDDLDKFGVIDVISENSDFYDEFKDVFKPLGDNTNAQDLVDFVNALKIALSDVTQSAVDTLHSKVPTYAQERLNPVVITVDELVLYRQTFKREASKDQVLSDKVNSVDFQHTKDYMKTIVIAMQEVIEYNDLHDENKKSEARTATDVLWEGQLHKDMQAYLDNGIPDIIVLDDRYEYINNGQLQVVATINDSDDTEHDVTVTFNGESKTVRTTDGKVAVTYDLADGVYDEFVEIYAKDKLTERKLTISSKPVVTVSDVEMFKRFVQALEADLGSPFDEMDKTTITSLKELYDKTLAIKVNVSSEREIREVENTATKLGGKNGQLESLVKLLVQNNRLEWLINNYKTATEDDFTWAEVVGVTPDNISALKSIIDNYVASFEGGTVKTPSVENYQSWINLSTIIKEARTAIKIAEELHTKEELAKAISTAEEKLVNVPDWLTVKNDLRKQLDVVIAYSNVIESVIKSETTYQQADKDAALALVEQLPDGTPKDNLLQRLDAVQTVIDATAAVGNAETTLEEADQVTAQTLVDEIDTGNTKKAELQKRLDALSKLKEAIAALEQAETSKTQTELDVAKELVEALPESPKKEELLDRVANLQDTIENKSKEDQAKDAVSKVEDSLLQEDQDKAQEKVDSLEDGSLKDELQERLDEIQTHVKSYKEASQAVEKAEISKEQTDNEYAQQLVDVLPDSKAKIGLQERLDIVSQFIQAEQGVSKAEVSLLQKHKNEAQKLVDALPISEEKAALQNRLDVLQIEIDNKKEDLLDKIINDLESVTSDELADYTGEKVYEELMPDYREGIDNLGDTVTKEQVIQVVKLINALELAKREMKLEFIIAYQKEYADASMLPTLDSYPQPAALSSIVDYLHDDRALNQVIKEISIALKVTEDEIRMEIEKILKDLSNDVTTGKYLVQYLSEENGEVIVENWMTGVPYGEIEVVGHAPEGYIIVGESTQSFTLSDETAEHVISFVIKPKQEENVETSDKEENKDNETLPDTQDTDEVKQPNNGLESDKNTEEDDTDDTESDGSLQEEIEVPAEHNTTENADTNLTQPVDENVEIDKIQVDKLTVDFIQASLLETLNLSFIEDEVLELYVQHIHDYAAEKDVSEYTLEELSVLLEAIQAAYGQEIGAEDKISKLVDGTVKDTLLALIEPKSTIGSEASLVRSKMTVASLNDSYLSVSSTPYGEWGTENENHAEYVFKTFYALASVKSYKASPSEKYKLEVKDYILEKLHKGSYKAMLLAELGYSFEEIGDEGKTDLTVVTPTSPPVVVEPPVIGPPVVVDPQPIKPKPPVVKPELPSGTVAETIDYDENGKWIITNPANDMLTLEHGDIKIKIPIEFKAKKWEVQWILKANQHYQLKITADGKEVTTFSKPIEITIESKKVYVLRFENGQYIAVPFTFTAPDQLQFKVKKTGEFKFSTNRITFKDIEGVFSKAAIEELASRYIVNGKTPDYYKPNDSLTRAEFSAMLVRGFGIDISEDYDGVFKDVKEKDWFAKDIQALYSTGIIKGITTTKFNPNSPLTRQQAAVMLDRAFEYLKVEKDESEKLDFSDVAKISEEAKPAVAVMNALGIFSGKPGNYFDPHSNLTRAEMAKVLQRTLEIVGQF